MMNMKTQTKRLVVRNTTLALAKNGAVMAAPLGELSVDLGEGATGWVTVTPAMAEEWVKQNTKNRKVSFKYVRFLADQIRRGQWIPNGQTVVFGVSGRLLDGQHRLLAIAEAGVPVQLLVVRGVPDEAFNTVDTGRVRTVSDALGISGEVNATTLAAAARRLQSWHDNQNFGRDKGRLSIMDTRNVLKRHPRLRDAVYWGCLYRFHIPGLGPSLLSTRYYLTSQLDEPEAAYFFDRPASGENLNGGHPILTLRNTLSRNATIKARYTREDLGNFFVKAWNLFCLGERRDVLKLAEGDTSKLEKPRGTHQSRFGV